MATTSFPARAGDWKGRFVFDMVRSVANGLSGQVRIWGPPGDLPAGVDSALSRRDAQFLDELSQAGGIAHLLRNRPLQGAWVAARLLRALRAACRREQPTLYHINWLQNALALPNDGRPALITVLGTDFRLLRLPGMVAALRHVLRRRRTILAPNAEWMVPELQRYFGDLGEVREIPFGVDSAWFQVARADPAGRRDWLAVVRLTRAKLGDLLAWGNGLFGPATGRRLHLFGPMQEEIVLPDWIEWHGPTHPRELQEGWFPRAAGILTLSRHAEGRPQVLLEAMAAGLPVLASGIPAHRDMISHRKTGWLCDSPEEFAEGLACIEGDDSRAIGQAGRQWVTDTLGDWDACGQRYVLAYRRLLDERIRIGKEE